MNEFFSSLAKRLQAPRMSGKERAFFMKRLSFLAASGMPIPEALEVLARQSNSRICEALLNAAHSTREGRTLAESMRAYPGIVPPFAAQVLHVGEESGTLSANLDYLADEMRKHAELRSKALGALLYPALIAVAAVILTCSLVLFIFPKILPIFSGLNVPLPFSTRAVLFLNSYLREWGIATLAALVLFATAVIYGMKKLPRVQAFVSKSLLHMPSLGPLLSSYHLSNTLRSLALLLRSGMPVSRALRGAARAASHPLYRAELEELTEAIENGLGMAERLRERKLFPEIAVQMIAVGESSGTLADTLGYLARYYENEMEESVRRLSSLVEPALMLIMGGIVGFVAVSMITPIYEITQHLHAK